MEMLTHRNNFLRTFLCLRALSILVLCLLLAPVLPAVAVSADGGTICGVIRDEDGKALAGAAVTLTNHSGSNSVNHATSGPAGEYRFSGLTEGDYTVGAELNGYAAATGRAVQITQESNTATVDLILVKNSKR
jgi:hypothetical protein